MKASAKKQRTHRGPARPTGPLTRPALAFDLSAEIQELRREGGWQGERNSKALVKHADFRVILTVLKAGAHLHEHSAPGTISVQTVSGHIRMHVQGEAFDLPQGSLLAIGGGILHDVEAIEDSAFLLTLAWPGEEQAE